MKHRHEREPTPEQLSRARLITAHETGVTYAKSGRPTILLPGFRRRLDYSGRKYVFTSVSLGGSEGTAPPDLLLIDRQVYDWQKDHWDSDLSYKLDPSREQVARVTERDPKVTYPTLTEPNGTPLYGPRVDVLGFNSFGVGINTELRQLRVDKPVTDPDEIGFIENLTVVAAQIMAVDT